MSKLTKARLKPGISHTAAMHATTATESNTEANLKLNTKLNDTVNLRNIS